MNCPRPEDLHNFLEDDLPVERRRELEGHLSSCPGCRRRAAEWRIIGEAAAGLPPLDVPAGFPEGVTARIQARRRNRRLVLGAGLGLPAAAAAVTLVFVRGPFPLLTGLGRGLVAAVTTAAALLAGLVRIIALADAILGPLLRSSGRTLAALSDLAGPGLQALLLALAFVLVAGLALGLHRYFSAGEQR